MTINIDPPFEVDPPLATVQYEDGGVNYNILIKVNKSRANQVLKSIIISALLSIKFKFWKFGTKNILTKG